MRPPEPPSSDYIKFKLRTQLTSATHDNSYLSSINPFYTGPEAFPKEEPPVTGHTQFPEFERILHVQTRKVGYLIGHHGRTIWGFENATGAKIDILNPNSRDSETPIRVTGPEMNVRHAVRLIMDLYGLHNFSSQHWQSEEKGSTLIVNRNKNVLIANEEVALPAAFASFLAHNELICYMEAESGAKIMIERERDTPDVVPMSIVGDCEAIRRAIDLVNEQKLEFDTRPDIQDLFLKLPVKVQADNPYKKFGKMKANYWRKRFQSENESLISQQGAGPHQVCDGLSDATEVCAQDPHEIVAELIVHVPLFDRISLQPISRYNDVTIETVILNSEDTELEGESMSTSGNGRKIFIRGFEPNVKNAKLELLREIELVSAI